MSNHIELLAKQLPKELRAELRAYINELLANDQWYGIDPSMLGFMEDYATLAELIGRHIIEPLEGMIEGQNFIIYDIGCATALQHVFFGKFLGYVGVSPPGPPVPNFFLPNCKFYSGHLSDVVWSMDIDYEHSFGIANMSILHDPHCNTDLKIFNEVFKRKFIM